MSRNLLLVLADPAEAKAVRRSPANSRDGPFKVEWVSRCADAVERLGDPRGEEIAAIVVGLFLPDSQGIETFDTLFRARPDVPILVLSRLRDENVARLAVQRGAQDYLLEEHLDGYSMPKALASMLERSAIAEALFLERERPQVMLASIGDAVISTDVAGNITYLNPIAESMTGWSLQEASGRPLQEVLRLIDGDSRELALNPLAMAILHNKTVGLSANCVLIRRDGYESAIEDTAAPIRDRRGQVTGAVIVFHDVSVARDVIQNVLFGPTRLSDRVAQPHVAERPADPGDRIRAPSSHIACSAFRGCGPLQAHQRYPRSCDRRSAIGFCSRSHNAWWLACATRTLSAVTVGMNS